MPALSYVCVLYLFSDDDMISMASLMSYGSAADDAAADDVGNLADFEDVDSTTNSFASFTAQMGSFISKLLSAHN